jgi:hypothetical protein
MEWLYALLAILAVLWLLGWRARLRSAARFPRWYNLERPGHVALLDEIRERYARVLADQSHEFVDCTFKPASLLPYPKEEIRKGLAVLLDFVEGRRDSTLLDKHIRAQATAQVLRGSLMQLETFLEVPAAELPRDPEANKQFGLRWLRHSEK